MIYRLYYGPDPIEDPDQAHQYGEILLKYALLHEKQLDYLNQTIIRNAWGKPALQDYPQVQFNVSHCKGLAACIVADVPVGIDAEVIRPYSPYAAMHTMNRQELEELRRAPDPNRLFFKYWTLKESCVKAMGQGVAYSMKKVAFEISNEGIRCLTQPEFQFVLLEDSGPYIIAACYMQGGKPLQIYENI